MEENQLKNIMDQLPNEMLAEIFDYLTGKDILVMFLVSKRFNKIVSRCSSLMEKIKIVFDFNKIQESSFTRSARRAKSLDPHVLFQCNRNYQAVEIRRMNKLPDESMLQILKKFQNMKLLILDDCELHQTLCLRPLLDIWKTTLNQIIVFDVLCSNEDGCSGSECDPLEFDRLRDLRIYFSSIEFFKNFTNSKLNMLKIDYYSMPSENFIKADAAFVNFLNSQANLKCLDLTLYGGSRIFLKTDLSSVKFQLDKLIFDAEDFSQETESINFQQFLRSQGKSLKHFGYSGFCSESICRIFLNEMPNLNYLSVETNRKYLYESSYNLFPSNNSITTFHIEPESPSDLFQNVIKFMKGLQTLNLTNGNVKFLFEADLKFLTVLRLDRCALDKSLLTGENGAFECLNQLELRKVSWKLTRHLIMKNPQITSLKISKKLEKQVRDLISTKTLNNLAIEVMPY